MPKDELHLRRIELRADRVEPGFPFDVPAIRSLPRLELTAPVTFFVGDNGSGKSTLLEAIAAASALPVVGSDEVSRDETLRDQRRLGRALRLVWRRRTHRGFFLRAEDFFGFARRLSRIRSEMHGRLDEVGEAFADASPFARGLAAGPARASLAALEQLYGPGLDARSHGEAFLALFQSRLVPNALYLLDEPEAALSPQSQLALIALIAETVANNCQFILATHSPILLAYPGATIFSFDRTPIERVRYEELQHVNVTRDFLNDPASYLRRLMPRDAAE